MGVIRRNFLYKLLLTFSNYVLGFVTLPYITRVLGPEKFGEVNFVMNAVDYYLLFASMGIMTIGTRETAMARNSKSELSTVASNIIGLNLLITFVVLIFYNASILLIENFRQYKELFWIGNGKILFSALLVEWLFTGIENFKYITIRSLAIKLLYVVLVFVLVRTSSDYRMYFILTILSFVVNALINFSYLLRLVVLKVRSIRISRYFKSNLKLGSYTIMASMYITFNVIFLGMVSTMDEVGYYSTSLKLYFVILSLFSAFTSVMLPRMASVINLGDSLQFNKYLDKSYRLVFIFGFPITIMSVLLSPEIIDIIAGGKYGPAIMPMRILMCALPVVWLSQVISIQGLAAIKRDNLLVYGAIIGAVLSVVMNLCLTAKNGAIGSSIVLLTSECSVTAFGVYMVHRLKLFSLPGIKEILYYFFWSVPILIVGVIAYFIDSTVVRIVLIGGTGCFVMGKLGLEEKKRPIDSSGLENI